MTVLVLSLIFSIFLNIFLIWYGYKVLAKLLYTSDNLGDLYIAFRVFEKFCDSLYNMDVFYGEPVIQELISKIKFIRKELEKFEDIYDLTLDMESLEEELDSDEVEEEARQEA